jgi:hypothetical protein
MLYTKYRHERNLSRKAGTGSPCTLFMYSKVCQLTDREKRDLYPRVMALHLCVTLVAEILWAQMLYFSTCTQPSSSAREVIAFSGFHRSPDHASPANYSPAKLGKDADEGQYSSLLPHWIKSRKKRKIEREEVTGGDIEKGRKRDRSRLCGRWRRVESAHFSPVQGTTRYTVKKS